MDPQYLCKNANKEALELLSFYVKLRTELPPIPENFPLLLGSENAGLLALTRIGSRRVVQISAGFMIFFSILGK